MKVINRAGTEIEFSAAVNLMDDAIREDLHAAGIETEQEFFTAYENAHQEKTGLEWELSKRNPIF